MQTLRQVLDGLPAVDRKRLMTAFNKETSCILRLPNDRYVGVYVSFVPNLVPDSDITPDSVWSKGKIDG